MSQWLRASEVTKLACITLTVSARVAKGSKSRVNSWPVTQPTTTTKGLQAAQHGTAQQHQAGQELQHTVIVLIEFVKCASAQAVSLQARNKSSWTNQQPERPEIVLPKGTSHMCSCDKPRLTLQRWRSG
jgi:hypothetical protein